MIKLVENNASAGISEFQWSTSEQVYPFELGNSGETLYCKEIVIGYLANSGWVHVAHNIVSFKRVYHILGTGNFSPQDTGQGGVTIPNGSTGYPIYLQISSTQVSVYATTDYTTTYGRVKLVYTK